MLRKISSRGPVIAMLVLAAAVTAGCAREKPKPQIAYEERPDDLLYLQGAQRLDKHQWIEAISYFDEVERQHPYSQWSRRAILMEAYAYYEANQYEDAVAAADRFVQLYPGSPQAGYAYYLKSVCYFEQIMDVQRDQGATLNALASLRDITQRYPKSDYALDAKVKIDMVNDQLAGKEMSVGRWYLRENQPLAAIGRFRSVVDSKEFQRSSHTPEALYRLTEAYLTMGLTDEAKRNAAVLGYNYPGDRWYRDAYKLLASNGLKPMTPPSEAGAKGPDSQEFAPKKKKKSLLGRLLPG